MTITAVNTSTPIPLNDRALQGASKMVKAASGVENNSLDNIIARESKESTTKAADTIAQNQRQQEVIDQRSLGSAPSHRQSGKMNLTV